MKKLLIASFIICAMGLMATVPTITVTEPNDRSDWHKGKSYPIRWTSSGILPPTVDIFLLAGDGKTKVMDIDFNTDNDGLYHWNVPNFLRPGNYIVVVKAHKKDISGASPIFNVSPPTASDAISLLSPHGNSTWIKGKTQIIQWSSIEALPGYVDITLFDGLGKRKVMDIALKITNTGKYQWQVPASIKKGRYVIQINARNHPAMTMSLPFMVSDPLRSDALKILSPNPGSKWPKGKLLLIKWNRQTQTDRKKIDMGEDPSITGIQHKSVRIEYLKVACTSGAKPVAQKWQTIMANVPNTGQFSWFVPQNIQEGCYIVRVTELYTEGSGDPGKFTAISQTFNIY